VIVNNQRPEQATATLGRYGVRPELRPALDAHWKALLDADLGMTSAFAAAYASYTAWLARDTQTPAGQALVAGPPAGTGTVEGDFSSVFGCAALPFLPAPAPPESRHPLGSATPAQPPSGPSSSASLTGTVEGDASMFGPVVPFVSPPPAALGEPDLARYPLEVYASITGALARGEARAQVLAERGLTPALFEKVAHAWGVRLAADPRLLLRFKALARASAAQGARKG
jgi:hypothetical protein